MFPSCLQSYCAREQTNEHLCGEGEIQSIILFAELRFVSFFLRSFCSQSALKVQDRLLNLELSGIGSTKG